MLLSPLQQKTVAESSARINLWEGAIRSSKTVASLHRWILYVNHYKSLKRKLGRRGKLYIIGKTMTSLRRNILEPLQDLLGRSFHYSLAKQQAYLFGEAMDLIGASDDRAEGKIRGSTCAGALGDEITLWPENFFVQLLGRMSVKGAKFFGTTNPDNPHHWLKKNYIDRAMDLNMRIFHFNIDDNPYLDPDYIAQLKLEYTGLWYKRFILGLWVAAEGAIYDFFDTRYHLLSPYDEPLSAWNDVSIDYGTSNATAFLLFGNNPQTTPRVWLKKIYYYSGRDSIKRKTDVDYGNDFEDFISGENISSIIMDPSAASFKAELRQRGKAIRNAVNDVLPGIQTVSRMLKNGSYKILDVEENTPMINEKYSYSWDSKASQKGKDQPLKIEDHCSDAERYKLHTDFSNDIVNYSLLNRM